MAYGTSVITVIAALARLISMGKLYAFHGREKLTRLLKARKSMQQLLLSEVAGAFSAFPLSLSIL